MIEVVHHVQGSIAHYQLGTFDLVLDLLLDLVDFVLDLVDLLLDLVDLVLDLVDLVLDFVLDFAFLANIGVLGLEYPCRLKQP